MAKISYTSFLILAILVFSVASSMVMKADAQQNGECQEILYPDYCNQQDCQDKCIQEHNGGRGDCIGLMPGRDLHYGCHCFYPC
ncbi:defensin-like protein 156 [Macadamia integrifolia]|uniref:defensin-like protein 156 n=1 Tax=Macadamia integrifolia TaxID=60698 RepID=UPI001C4FF2D3|nr:defensin-like protein 156 [Macadamia integrifolia]